MFSRVFTDLFRFLERSIAPSSHMLCSCEYLSDELDFLHKLFLNNAYPNYFIDKHKVTEVETKLPIHSVERKPIWLRPSSVLESNNFSEFSSCSTTSDETGESELRRNEIMATTCALLFIYKTEKSLLI